MCGLGRTVSMLRAAISSPSSCCSSLHIRLRNMNLYYGEVCICGSCPALLFKSSPSGPWHIYSAPVCRTGHSRQHYDSLVSCLLWMVFKCQWKKQLSFHRSKRTSILEPSTFDHAQECTYRLARVPCFNTAAISLGFYSKEQRKS